LIAKIRAVTPSHLQYVIDDFFESITLYDNRALSARTRARPDGRYDVALRVFAKKRKADELGRETDAPLGDWIDIGVLDADGQPLFSRRRRSRRRRWSSRWSCRRNPRRPASTRTTSLSTAGRRTTRFPWPRNSGLGGAGLGRDPKARKIRAFVQSLHGPRPLALMLTFQRTLLTLQDYWGRQGCALLQPYDLEVGAGTSHTATFLRALGPEPWRAAYVQPSRRPKDGRYGENPNRLHQHHQFQVVLKPSPADILDLYLGSLAELGFELAQNDVRFVEDDWENPTLGAWGLGWEVWLNGMEITQFTYFQQVGGLDCNPITGEITYGLERMCMYLQDVESVFDLRYTDTMSYRDVFFQNEVEQSKYAFEASDAAKLFLQFAYFESEAKRLLEAKLPLPGYEMILKAGHTFNLLDARGAISVTERAAYIGRIRNLSRFVATAYVESREALGFPMLPPEHARVTA